ERAEELSQTATRRFHDYREGTIAGAGRAVTGLEVTRDVSVASVGIMATIATGGAAATLIATGYGAGVQVAQQGTEVALGLRQRVDWAGIGFDAVVGLVTGRLGGSLGGKISGRLL